MARSMPSEGCLSVGGRGLISNILSLCPYACEMVCVPILSSENAVTVHTDDGPRCHCSPVSCPRGERSAPTPATASLLPREGTVCSSVFPSWRSRWKKDLTFIICCFPGCKCPNHGQFQATEVMRSGLQSSSNFSHWLQK